MQLTTSSKLHNSALRSDCLFRRRRVRLENMAYKTLDLADVEYLRKAIPALQKVIPWTVGWSCLYAVFRFGALRTRTAGFSNRVVSLLHAIIAIFMCTRCLPTWGALLENVGGMNTMEHLECMTLSLSYFVYDFLYCLLDNDVENVIHHLFTIGGLASGVITGRSGPELVGCLFLMEVSNPEFASSNASSRDEHEG